MLRDSIPLIFLLLLSIFEIYLILLPVETKNIYLLGERYHACIYCIYGVGGCFEYTFLSQCARLLFKCAIPSDRQSLSSTKNDEPIEKTADLRTED